MAQSFIRWTQFGECRTAGWDCAPPTASETDAALTAALALPEAEPVAWMRKWAADKEMPEKVKKVKLEPPNDRP